LATNKEEGKKEGEGKENKGEEQRECKPILPCRVESRLEATEDSNFLSINTL
jgi:hypothetical protein